MLHNGGLLRFVVAGCLTGNSKATLLPGSLLLTSFSLPDQSRTHRKLFRVWWQECATNDHMPFFSVLQIANINCKLDLSCLLKLNLMNCRDIFPESTDKVKLYLF